MTAVPIPTNEDVVILYETNLLLLKIKSPPRYNIFPTTTIVLTVALSPPIAIIVDVLILNAAILALEIPFIVVKLPPIYKIFDDIAKQVHVLLHPVPKGLNQVLVDVLNAAIRFQEFPFTVEKLPPTKSILPYIAKARQEEFKPVPNGLNHVDVTILNAAIEFQAFPFTLVNGPLTYKILSKTANTEAAVTASKPVPNGLYHVLVSEL